MREDAIYSVVPFPAAETGNSRSGCTDNTGSGSGGRHGVEKCSHNVQSPIRTNPAPAKSFNGTIVR